ncbi:atypical chemokine receptor 1 [Elephas maximus indicus]|uniref:atypical chemokine receptor 1 n=1 Tax=Elephas maximus indicus TaxID=99487 RepID=UPI00211641F8|nr:atypical chemokine receptor 1 [Elephas maximus indicus]
MGNCLHPVTSSVDDNSSKFSFENYEWNMTYDSLDYNDPSLQAAAPCHSCNLLDDSSLPFFIMASVLGILASGTALLAFLRPLFHWELCRGRPILVQLAVGSALFSVVVPILAPGISSSHSTALCRLGYSVWYGSAFAQALLIGCRACLGPKLDASQVSSHTLVLTVGLWGTAALLALPITLASDTSQGLCTLAYSRGLGTLQCIHAAVCFAIFFLLPLGLVGAKGLKKVFGRGPGPWVDILWVWFSFWWPHGVILGFDTLVRSGTLPLQTCLAQQILDLLLQLAEALATLHCVATPLLLAFFCHRTVHTSFLSLPLHGRQSSHVGTLGSKS